MIEIKRIAGAEPYAFDVVIREGGSRSRHRVTMSSDWFEPRAAGRHTPERCIEAAFRFLLDREPAAAILARFDVSEIARYFPEFDRVFPDYLS